jgi:putative phosphoribosyl transferase
MTHEFATRAEAGRILSRELLDEKPMRPVVLAIPRGGIEVAEPLAEELSADLDVVLARKLRAPFQPELAIGAVCEDGTVVLAEGHDMVAGVTAAYLAEETATQLQEIARRRAMYRAVRPAIPLAGRHVIVTDDGIATGSTMIAALRMVRATNAAHVTAAIPVASPDRLESIRPLCDRVVCLLAPEAFLAVGQFYRSFDQVEDARVVEILRAATRSSKSPGPSSSP